MSINKMLIDATHPEETRVVVLRENRVEEFDYESAARKLLRGSIYLAKITRVEPSLQAAFVDYGGNRHGFLAFAEIHPDYYQIPHADKVALLEEEERRRAEYEDELDQEDDAAIEEAAARDGDESEGDERHASDADSETLSHNDSANGTDDGSDGDDDDHDYEAGALDVTHLLPDEEYTGGVIDARGGKGARANALDVADDDVMRETDADDHVHITADADDSERDDADDEDDDAVDAVESLNDDSDDDDDHAAIATLEDDSDEEDDADTASSSQKGRQRRRRTSSRPRPRLRSYKIQEVIKRRQIVLIQVVKEERGNKGAALTTYLSLAGRYTVLMPNTARGGGISRKITNIQDRKRLKAIAQELEVPEGMGLIIRTAGAARTKQEIKRDFEYLLRLWENVRNLTLESTAPSLVYEEGNLIKRSIRDLYTKEIDEVVVAGEEAHREAKSFMRMLMPSHAKNVTKHEGAQSLFAKYRIEAQLNAMFSPNVQLKSGGYLVINQTEALVAIDVNSGKSTREFSIEETALNTNLEAAEELARQLKLRDLAGLIVVDFIDMEENRNNRAVERRLKDALKVDRARIQVGRISHFGLLEMSRQRLRTGVLEGSTAPCEHCQGTGIIRSIESVSLAVLRGLEDALVAGKTGSCIVQCASEVALYLLNQKRPFIQELEERYGVTVYVRANATQQGANFTIEPLRELAGEKPRIPARDAINVDSGFSADPVAANDDESTEEAKPRRRRRRRGRGRDEASEQGEPNERMEIELADNDDGEPDSSEEADDAVEASDQRPRRSRRRGRRGGRRHREQRGNDGEEGSNLSEPGAEQPAFAASSEQPAAQAQGDEVHSAADEPAAAGSSDDAADAPRLNGHHVEAAQESSGDAREAPHHEEVAKEPIADAEAVEVTASAAEISHKDADPEVESVAARMETLEQPASAKAAPAPAETAHEADAPAAKAEPVAETPAEVQAAPEVVAPEVAAEAEKVETETEAAPPTGDDHGRAARSQPVAGAPVLQRLQVGPNGAESANGDQASVAAEEAASNKPARRGWWQRQFGG